MTTFNLKENKNAKNIAIVISAHWKQNNQYYKTHKNC